MGVTTPPKLRNSAGVELALDHAPRIAPLLAARIAGLAERAPAELTYGNLWLKGRPAAAQSY